MSVPGNVDLVVKLEPGVGGFRSMGDELHAFEREIRFYREVAAAAPIRLARLYHAVSDPPDYAMVMEDLSFARPGDQVAGMHAGQVAAVAHLVGRLQGSFWGESGLTGLAWMPDSNRVGDDFAGRWPGFVAQFRDALGPQALALGESLCRQLPWVEEEMRRRPRTIVHSDLRADNLMFGEPGTDDEVLIVDWQVAVRGLGATDIARLLGGSEVPRERRGHHLEILRVWYDAVCAQGVDYGWDEAARDFQLGALAMLAYPVHFSGETGDLSGRAAALVEAMAGRLFHAALESDAPAILP